MTSTPWSEETKNSTTFANDIQNSTGFSGQSKNSTGFTESFGKSSARTASLGTPYGLLLALTHPVNSTVTYENYGQTYTKGATNSTIYT